MAKAKRYTQKSVAVKDIKLIPWPSCPWDFDTAHRLWQKSHAHGHRVLWFKCRQCSLEYQVRTWRDGDDLEKHFPYCPECGLKSASFCCRVDNALGPIFQAEAEGG